MYFSGGGANCRVVHQLFYQILLSASVSLKVNLYQLFKLDFALTVEYVDVWDGKWWVSCKSA
jgi:hypothetical protein